MSRTTNRNLAARMGRWSAAHWKTATFGWIAFVLVAFGLGGMAGTKAIDPTATGPGESGRMDRILDAGFKQPAGESVLIQSDSLRTEDPAFAAAVEDVIAAVTPIDVVQNVSSPFAAGNAHQISPDGHSALVEFQIRGEAEDAVDKITPVVDRVAEVQAAHPDLFIGEFGDASVVEAVGTAYVDDLAKAGELSLPITLIVLVLTFGSLVAAGIPLLLGLTAVFATFGLMAVLSQILPQAMQAPALVLLIGLAVGVDYSMFYLKRERQERAAGRSPREALEIAAATSGRSVLVSGLTVMAAMAGMFLTGDGTFASLALATIVVVAVAVLGSLTVLPALLGRLGDGVDRLRVPFVGRRRRKDGEGRIWGAIVDRVLRRPLLSAIVAGGLLVALAAPALQLRMATPDTDTFPKLPALQTYDRMQEAFPGTGLPATVVVEAPDVSTPAVRDAIDAFSKRAVASDRIYEPITVTVNEQKTVANITVPIAGKTADDEANAAVSELRDEIVPETVGAVPDVEAGVTGLAAQWHDQQEELTSNLRPVFAFVLVLAFALMLVAFRSVVVATKAIVLNLLSVAAAYGVLVLVFQHGVGKGLLGFSSTAGIDPVVPLLLFVILFGLSMDYHVFILSRIRETFDRGASMDEAVSHGIKSTAGVVTSAAIVMVGVFSVFTALSMLFFKQFGIGLAAAVLIDATIVRAVLLPASMKLLGEWNWYLPRWLRWLPHLEQSELEPVEEPEPAVEPKADPVRAAKRKRSLTFGRITGLVLVGLIVLGLSYLRFAPEESLSVPSGAKAGDLILEQCDYTTENGSYAADCGTLVVPENRADPQSRLIALPVKRIRALSADPAEPIFRLEGGPGITNMQFANASRFADDHDVVLVGYRGMDGTSALDCPEVESEMKRSADLLGERSFGERADAFRACADRLTDEGFDLAGYSLPQRVDDLEAARVAFGYGRIDLLSESAGTRTAMIYAWRYPKSIHRSVMLAVNPPGHFVWDPKTTDEQIRRYAALCAEDEACRGRTPDLAAALRSANDNIPEKWGFLPVKEGNVQAGAFFGLMNATTDGAGPLAGPWTIDTLLSANEGDGSGAWFMSLLAQVAFPSEQRWGDVAAVARTDAQQARRLYAADGDSIMGKPGTDLYWAGGQLLDAWPANPDEDEYDQVRGTDVETLVINGELDVATPPQWATRELLPYLRNGREVILDNFGHSDDFWSYQPEAGTRLITTYFDSGRVDTSGYKPAEVDFTPVFSHGKVAKIVLAAMLAFGAIAALSLIWMAVRVLRRGGYGRKASATLRWVYPIVLGLGGYFAAVLIVLATMPTLPIDDAALATLAVGVPVGLGIFLAWMNRERSAGGNSIGFVAAMAAALAGAWLGFHTLEGLLGLLTTIAGAVAGANLALIGLDIRGERQPRAATEAKEALEARPAVG